MDLDAAMDAIEVSNEVNEVGVKLWRKVRKDKPSIKPSIKPPGPHAHPPHVISLPNPPHPHLSQISDDLDFLPPSPPGVHHNSVVVGNKDNPFDDGTSSQEEDEEDDDEGVKTQSQTSTVGGGVDVSKLIGTELNSITAYHEASGSSSGHKRSNLQQVDVEGFVNDLGGWERGNDKEDDKVRQRQERSDKLTTQLQAAETTHARTLYKMRPLLNHHKNAHSSFQPFSRFVSGGR